MLKLSITTPSFNQVDYVDRTLRSISTQTFPVHEHLIYDGGSNDGALERLSAYASTHSNVILEIGKDKSQSNAINLGFARSTGDVLCWLNTDDWYIDRTAVADVLQQFEQFPDVDIVYGRGQFVDQSGAFLREAYVHVDANVLGAKLVHSVGILQPALFMRRAVYDKVGPINENLHYCFDYEFWIRAFKSGMKFRHLDRVVCQATLHTNSKTMGQRVVSLRETAAMVGEQFGFVPVQWLERLADSELEGADGILKITQKKSAAHAVRTTELFRSFNSRPGAIAAMSSFSVQGEVAATIKMFRQQLSVADWFIVTAIDSKFFASGLTLIANARKHATKQSAFIVYDLGLSSDQRALLSQLDGVWVMDLPKGDPRFFDSYFSSRTYGFKSYCMSYTATLLPTGRPLLWMDGGIAPIKDLQPIFDAIEHQGVFIVDHDDKSLWPFHNLTFCSDACAHAVSATNAELIAPHVRAGVAGYRVGGPFQRMFDECFQLSLNPEALLGDKHPAAGDSVRRKTGKDFNRVLSDPDYRDSLSSGQLRELFGYMGHRHDQTILSILVARHNAPVLSAKRFCIADENSSALSKNSWTNVGASVVHRSTVDPFYQKSPAILMQHRGTFLDTQGLPFRVDRERTAVVLGNGPSLKGFDFKRLDRFDVFGMNAAYRFWDRIKWYPQYYSCLDLVLGLSHVTEISRLIDNADRYGIRQFLLRDNLIRQLTATRNRERIINFDEIKLGAKPLSVPTISTGSHTAGWAVWLGYKSICLMGIDANYVEVIDAAKHGKGTELEIVKPVASNPNYFFDDYQKVGDKYNIPNPNRAIHIDSWREIADAIAGLSANIYNGNPVSRVDAFPFCDFAALEATGQIKLVAASAKQTTHESAFTHAISGTLGWPREAQAEVDETAVVARLLSQRRGKQYVMLDVGAHVGTSASYFHSLGWSIHCFEPDPVNREKLIARFGKAENVTIDSRAVSDKPANGLSFFRSEESTGISGLLAFRETHRESHKVDVTTVADFVEARGLTQIDFLKIDVEGFDLSVLKGVPWETLKPDVVECEYEDTKTRGLGHTWRDIAEYLRQRGYVIYISEWHPIVRYGISHDWRRVIPYPSEGVPSESWGNLVAFRQDPGYSAVKAAFDVLVKQRGVPEQKKATGSPAPKVVASAPIKPTVPSGEATAAQEVKPIAAAPTVGVPLLPPAPVFAASALYSPPPQQRLILFPIHPGGDGAAAMVHPPNGTAGDHKISTPPPPPPPAAVAEQSIIEMQRPIASQRSAAEVQVDRISRMSEQQAPQQVDKRGIPLPQRLAAWVGKHLMQRRSAQMAAFAAIVVIGAGAYAFAQAEFVQVQLVILALAVAGVVAVGLFYLAYRTLALASTLNLQNAELRSQLRDVERETREKLQVVQAALSLQVNRASVDMGATLNTRIGDALRGQNEQAAKLQQHLDAQAGALEAAKTQILLRVGKVETQATESALKVGSLQNQTVNNTKSIVELSDRFDSAQKESSEVHTGLANAASDVKRALAGLVENYAEHVLRTNQVADAIDALGRSSDVKFVAAKAELDHLSEQIKLGKEEREGRLSDFKNEIAGVVARAIEIADVVLRLEQSTSSKLSLLDARVVQAGERHTIAVAGLAELSGRVDSVADRLVVLAGQASATSDSSVSRVEALCASMRDLAERVSGIDKTTQGRAAVVDRSVADLAVRANELAAQMKAANEAGQASFDALKHEIAKVIMREGELAVHLAKVETDVDARMKAVLDAAKTSAAKLDDEIRGHIAKIENNAVEVAATLDRRIAGIAAAQTEAVTRTEAFGQHIGAVDQKTDGLAQQVQLVGQRTEALSQQIQAHSQKTDALGRQTDEASRRIAEVATSADAATKVASTRIAKVETDVDARMKAVLDAAKTSAAKLDDEIRGHIAKIENNAVEVAATLDRRIAGIAAAQTEAVTRTEAFGQHIGAVDQKTDGLAQQVQLVGQRTEALSQQIQAHSQKTDALGRQTDEASRRIAEVATSADAATKVASTRIDGLAGEVGGVAKRVTEVGQFAERTSQTAIYNNASVYQRFSRKLMPEQIDVLEKQWTRKLSVSVQRSAFGYMAARACEVERVLDGRLATSIEDILLRTLVAQATKGPSVEVLEIGTLFGTGAAIMFDGLKNHFERVHFTLLDPLEGYYSSGRPDILTGQPVTERALRRNLSRIGMKDDEFCVIPHLSTDPRAIEQASERLYDVLIIDADHSYAGVKADFENYARMVRLGGYVVFDDYGSDDWPDIKTYVDTEMPRADFLAPVGNAWRTAVYRVVKPPQTPAASRKGSQTSRRKAPAKSVIAAAKADRTGSDTKT